ncbi:MAG: hypothetical protein ACYC2P_10720 [Paludibacteraceae bacterium]
MIPIHSDSKIYVLCPAGIQTGGTELAHQLVDALLHKNLNAFIAYTEKNKIIQAFTPEGFTNYHLQAASNVDDEVNNVLVCPESMFEFIEHFRKIQILCWWMSVDNFYRTSTIFSQLLFFGPFQTLKNIYARYLRHQKLTDNVRLSKLKKNKNIRLHLYQSEYAGNFLLSKKITDLMPLSDYINQEFHDNYSGFEDEKENIILYNPKKGLEITKRIILQMPSYEFVPIQDMNRSELNSCLKRAKLYIDFGSHPGKDRLPREAAANYCCVITGKKGSAAFYEDIPIPDDYKFDERNISEISETIKDILKNFDMHIRSFSIYRKKIKCEKEVFGKEVDAIFK